MNKVTHEPNDALVRAQFVGVRHAARQDEAGIIVGLHFSDRMINCNSLPLVVVLHTLNPPRLRSDDLGLGASVLQCLLRLQQFRLFKPVSRDNGKTLASELTGHSSLHSICSIG